MMEGTRIKLSALWVSLMLTYLLGDVLRIFSGDFVAGELSGMEMSQGLMVGMAALMVIPVVMVLLSLILKHAVNRWTNIILSIFFFVFNAIGLPTYPSLYDQFLIVVGLVFNLVILWVAWKWKAQEA
jgi:phosphoglycerol transferase MdoB-like AlkP superfamily enzyme